MHYSDFTYLQLWVYRLYILPRLMLAVELTCEQLDGQVDQDRLDGQEQAEYVGEKF